MTTPTDQLIEAAIEAMAKAAVAPADFDRLLPEHRAYLLSIMKQAFHAQHNIVRVVAPRSTPEMLAHARQASDELTQIAIDHANAAGDLTKR